MHLKTSWYKWAHGIKMLKTPDIYFLSVAMNLIKTNRAAASKLCISNLNTS